MPELLSADGREQLALALHLLRQWKTKDGPAFDVEVSLQIIKMARHFGVKAEYDALLVPLPRYRFVPIEE
jgi:hypothetical protein